MKVFELLGGTSRSLLSISELPLSCPTICAVAELPSLAPSSHASPTVDLPPLPTSHLPAVIAAYDAAIVSLIDSKQRDLAVIGMHELGSLMYHSHNSK